MTVIFPNPSRSYDATENRVQFWGYDSVKEIAFFIEVATLRKLCPEMSDVDTGVLKAFDSVVKNIHEVAGKVYMRASKSSGIYRLAANDF